MKFSFNWIREFVPGLKLSPPELARLVTMKTAECEACTAFAPHLARVVAARVLSVEPIPGSHNPGSHNKVALVDAGPLYGRKQVVCGAPNCRPGIVTAYVPAGVMLGSREIRKAVIAGVESDGMLASGAELEINRDHEGIVECEAEPGDALPGCAPDYVIEVDNKSLTHRPDLWGHHGLAREVAAITGERLYDPVDLSLLPAPGNEWNVEILDYDLCPRYSGLVFDNVRVGPSPLWLQARLESIGLNPISNIVDVTNLLLAGLPQPMHAFDADKLHGRTIFVRRAAEGEVLAALDGETYTLNPSNLVIADAAGAVALAGVIDNWRGPTPTRVIDLPLEWVARKLGRPVDGSLIRQILESLEFGVAASAPGVLAVTVPTWRATKDVTINEDLLEEIGRMVGYDTIPAVAPLQPATRPWINRPRFFQHEVRALCAAQGFTEVQNYSFISEDLARRFGFDPAAHLRVVNPISSEQSLLRTSLLPGLHRNLLENAKRFAEFRLFEIGYEIHKQAAGVLPEEIPHLMAAIYSTGDGAAALFELKRLAECLMPGCEALPAAARPYEHPARSASIAWRGVEPGRLFELHPTLMEAGRGAFLDVDLGALFRLGAEVKKYTPLQRFPSTAFDLSVVTGLRELSGLLRRRILAAAGPCCESVEYLYAYRGKPLPDDRQSLTYRVTLSAPDRTLSSEDLTAVRSSLIDALRAAGYELRL